uniref:Uncharacterized protein n=1 Tax=Kwoniella bestiolae CBS 10118 TaxID=1296100 RepID=A0A1B9G157_9TREE|nr:hypothetical protein I302_06225 [Kwoniella bestiolae CBS 10118]OCF24764.1 hypothetical protein I302_06225 [Kwoniella bestiolae CBS 10118]
MSSTGGSDKNAPLSAGAQDKYDKLMASTKHEISERKSKKDCQAKQRSSEGRTQEDLPIPCLPSLIADRICWDLLDVISASTLTLDAKKQLEKRVIAINAKYMETLEAGELSQKQRDHTFDEFCATVEYTLSRSKAEEQSR